MASVHDLGYFEKLSTIYRNEGDVNMLLTAVRKERQDFFNKGKLEGKKEITKMMLLKGLDVAFISEMIGLSCEEIAQLKQEVKNII